MNLHGIVSPAVSAINPPITATLRMSAGYTTAGDGTRTPAYAPDQTAQVQVQALGNAELRQLDSLNIQGVMRAVYLNGNWQGVDRPDGKGGDLILFGGQTWLVMQVMETWPDWCKVAVCLQQ